jgi:hypothetical protein
MCVQQGGQLNSTRAQPNGCGSMHCDTRTPIRLTSQAACPLQPLSHARTCDTMLSSTFCFWRRCWGNRAVSLAYTAAVVSVDAPCCSRISRTTVRMFRFKSEFPGMVDASVSVCLRGRGVQNHLAVAPTTHPASITAAAAAASTAKAPAGVQLLDFFFLKTPQQRCLSRLEVKKPGALPFWPRRR